MDALERMMAELNEVAELNNIRLVSGERVEDPGMLYFFYLDYSSGRPVSPYFHSQANAETWLYKHMG